MGKSILQDWVTDLGLRHQGVLLTVIRGCDTAPKEDASKRLTRIMRSVILNAHCGDPKKAATFIEWVEPGPELMEAFRAFRKNCDHYTHHYVMHVVHAAQIIGYYYPDAHIKRRWQVFYENLCEGLDVNYEGLEALEERLNASEDEFRHRDNA